MDDGAIFTRIQRHDERRPTTTAFRARAFIDPVRPTFCLWQLKMFICTRREGGQCKAISDVIVVVDIPSFVAAS